MTSTDQRWYDKGIRVGTKGVGAGKILADFRIAAEECLRRGCDEAAARQIVQNYTIEETWFDALFGLGIFYNFDGFTTFWADIGPHNFGLFLDDPLSTTYR